MEGFGAELVTVAGSAGGGAWLALRFALRAVLKDIEGAHAKADSAHRRIDEFFLSQLRKNDS